ncbi:MAG: hypothetical protein H6830_01335 [Planctomycetes bacterium]|nr:hypothetical protein [Planctomycetota bacterium]MCB9910889.1 hypothetical protein [Planctomycetota bacterium]MCB9912100.1 hypothetical protein [Planctomycetota bacterium]HPF14353.1 hypothetical protein [Planctomycetota bacterium]HRV81443.1 hypothetical protein [Planctomycetota bacterium]
MRSPLLPASLRGVFAAILVLLGLAPGSLRAQVLALHANGSGPVHAQHAPGCLGASDDDGDKDGEKDQDGAKDKDSDKDKGDDDGDSDDGDDADGDEGDDDSGDSDDDSDDESDDDDSDEGNSGDEGKEETVIPLTIETLTSITWTKGKALPDEVMKFDGKLVRISGYISAGTQAGSAEFDLVPQNCECGRNKVSHFVQVTIEDGGAEFDPARVQFTGRLEIGEVEEDGFVTSLYRLKIETFDPVEPDDDTSVQWSELR